MNLNLTQVLSNKSNRRSSLSFRNVYFTDQFQWAYKLVVSCSPVHTSIEYTRARGNQWSHRWFNFKILHPNFFNTTLFAHFYAWKYSLDVGEYFKYDNIYNSNTIRGVPEFIVHFAISNSTQHWGQIGLQNVPA